MSKKSVALSPPWWTYVHYIESIFKGDSEVHVQFDDDTYLCKILVDTEEKYEAIRNLMPSCKSFGNVILKIEVVPADESLKASREDVLDWFKKAFKGNPNVKGIKSVEMFGAQMNYVIFKKEVVQFFNDDISDIHGVQSTLNENIARELFEEYVGINFCTDTE